MSYISPMAYTFHDLKSKTVAQLRELATDQGAAG